VPALGQLFQTVIQSVAANKRLKLPGARK